MAFGYIISPEMAGYYAGKSKEKSNDPMAQLMTLLGRGGGNPLTGAAISAGGALLGQLSGLLGGESAGEKRAKETYKTAKSHLNDNAFDPLGYVQDVYNMMRPEMNRRSGEINKRLGLDSGVAEGELASMFIENAQNQLLGLKLKQTEMNMNNRNMMLQIMASLGA